MTGPTHPLFDAIMAPWHQGTGAERKAVALELLEAWRKEALEAVRLRLRVLYHEREVMYGQFIAAVHGDDAARIFSDLVLHQHPEWGALPRAFLGAVFKGTGWKFQGRYIQSTQPKNHGRLLRCWRWDP